VLSRCDESLKGSVDPSLLAVGESWTPWNPETICEGRDVVYGGSGVSEEEVGEKWKLRNAKMEGEKGAVGALTGNWQDGKEVMIVGWPPSLVIMLFHPLL
jgi:hypothetical protein